MTSLTKESAGPAPTTMAKYEWVKRVLLDHIDQNLQIGDPVPSERELADELGVARMTARRALDELVTSGRIVRVVGRGSFVAAPSVRTPLTLTSFTADMLARGHQPGSTTLVAERATADELVAARLAVRVGTPVYRLDRLRTSDGIPMAIERVHLPAALAPTLDLDALARGGSLYQILAAEHDLVFDGGEQVIGARAATDQEAKLLDIKPGAPLLRLYLTATYRGQIAEVNDSVFRADRYELTTKF